MTKLKIFLASIAIISCVGAARAQDFSLTTPAGDAVSGSSMRGKVIVLLFSGIQDPQRREGLKALEALGERFQGKDVKVCWVSVNSATDMSNDQLKAAGSGSIVVLRDANQASFKRFSGKLAQLPTIVVLDRQGNPFGQPRGGFNPNSDFINDLASTIDKLLQH